MTINEEIKGKVLDNLVPWRNDELMSEQEEVVRNVSIAIDLTLKEKDKEIKERIEEIKMWRSDCYKKNEIIDTLEMGINAKIKEIKQELEQSDFWKDPCQENWNRFWKDKLCL
jgi:hypothetical protein